MADKPKLIITIDGYSSCGKSTFARAIAAELKYRYVDSGAMYRAATLACLEAGIFNVNENPSMEKIIEVTHTIDISFCYNPEKKVSETCLDGKVVEEQIRSMEVSGYVSLVSSVRQVRERMVDLQRKMGKEKGIVMDGRDIGTVVFPAAEIKIFMTASPEVRAMRRYLELTEKGSYTDFEIVRQNILQRDEIDQSREASPLRKADDAIVLDNSDMNPMQQMEWFRALYQKTLSGL
ncbi:MAG: (d)CMP kinase [Bacteroidota bacterium]